MVGACLCFVTVGACVKFAAAQYSFFEMAAYRGAIGMAFTALIGQRVGGTLRTNKPAGHFWRGVIGITALLMWFYSLTGLPLAASMTLNYTSPIFLAAILAIAGFVGTAHRRPHAGLMAAIGLSFLGVALLLKPTITQDQWIYGIAGLLSGFISAFAYLQVQQLGRAGEPEYRVVFYFSVTGLIAGSVGALLTTGLHAHTSAGVGWLFAIGILASVGQMMMTRAYTLGNTLVTANLQYSGVLIASAIGYMAFGETLDGWGWAGAALIVASGIFALFIRAAPVEETLSTH